MKRMLYIILFLALMLSACAQNEPASPGETLTVSGGAIEKSYTAETLRELGEAQAVFRDVIYLGVPLFILLQDAGFDPSAIKAVKAVAADGFSANYEAALFTKEDTLVSFARADGPLVEDEGPFRMVLPDQEGKLNPRQIAEIVVIP